MNQDEIIEEIYIERIRQDLLHPDNQVEEYLAILIEEVGEVAKAMQEGNQPNLKEELIQVASVAVRWLEAL